MAAVRDLDYTINGLARGLQIGRTQTVGMFIPDLANPLYAKVVRGVEDVLRDAGYSLLLGNTYDSANEQGRYLSVFRSKQVDGMLVFCAPGAERDFIPLVRKRVPIVFVGRVPKGIRADSVSANNLVGTGLIMNHLLRKHRKIALITGPVSVSANRDRAEAWRAELKRARISAPEAYLRPGELTADAGYRSACELLNLGARRPTAIFCGSFLVMTGVLRAVRDKGLRCPEDVEITSADDSEWLDVFDPPISTVIQPSNEMGARAAELLLRRIDSGQARADPA